MTPAQFLTLARKAARMGIKYWDDAVFGAGSFAVSRENVIHALDTATECEERDSGWIVYGGVNLDGDELTMEVQLSTDGRLSISMLHEGR